MTGPTVTATVREATLFPGQIITLWLTQDAGNRRRQVEIRVTPQGVFELFHRPDDGSVPQLAIKHFEDWFPL